MDIEVAEEGAGVGESIYTMSKNMKPPSRTLAMFEGKKIRRMWDGEAEKWWFSVVDVVFALTNSPNVRSYWKVLKFRLKKEGSEVVTKCNQLKMEASDGKFYLTDVADTETMLASHTRCVLGRHLGILQ